MAGAGAGAGRRDASERGLRRGSAGTWTGRRRPWQTPLEAQGLITDQQTERLPGPVTAARLLT